MKACEYVENGVSYAEKYPLILCLFQTINSITNGLFWRTQTTSQEVPKDT